MSTPKKYLIYRLSDGLCVNCIVWDGVSPYTPDEGTAIELVPAGSFAGIGWTRTAENVWVQPNFNNELPNPEHTDISGGA